MYNFKKDIKVYVEYQGCSMPIDVYPDITFSQTFNENDYNQKTLHEPLNLNKGATIVEANEATFSFTTPIKYDNTALVDSLLFSVDYETGNIEPINIYIQTTNKTFKLETCVIEQLTLNIEKAGIFTISVSGRASRLEEAASLPTTLQPQNTDPYCIIRCVNIQIDDTLIDTIASINIDVVNEIEWVRNTTMHNTLSSNIVYKQDYVLTERRISGSITEFLLDTESALPEFSTSSSMTIEMSSEVGQTPPFLAFNLPQVVYTRRLSVDDLITRVYDFRLTDNAVSVIPSVQGV